MARGLGAASLICLAMTVIAHRLNGLSCLVLASGILLIPVLVGMRHWAHRRITDHAGDYSGLSEAGQTEKPRSAALETMS